MRHRGEAPGLKALLASDGPGGLVIRRLLPLATALLVVIAVLGWQGERLGLYGTTVGVLLMTAAAIAVIGSLLCYLAYALDRNERARRAAEGELTHSARYFELSRDLVCTVGFDGVFRELNAAWTVTLGWSEAELRSRPFIEFVHPDDRAMTERESAGLQQGDVTVDFVNRYATNDGGWRWLEWKAGAILAEGLIYASARDVTTRRETEAALAASERQTRQILETAHDAFVSIDADGLITAWSAQAQASFGWSADEARGRELAATIIPEANREAHRNGIARFLATGEAVVLGKRIELMALHRDGREFPVELTISPIETDQGFSFNAFLRDITERKRDQEELALARDEALESSRMKSMFVANVSHEIRTPMNGVLGMTELLLDTDLDDEQREYAETISSSGEVLLEVIDDILDFSKIEAGKLTLDPTDLDLREAIERACGMLAARAHKKGLELVVAIDPEVPALVHGDAARLRQVIANLVSNAIKFTAAGEVVVHVSSGPVGDGAATIRLEVSDTGIGIGSEALEQLFTPFSQADGSTTRKYGGTGLGLAISRQLIELMGGTVGAHSEPGKGSTFWFQVSLARAEGSDLAPGDEREIAGLRVLVVDDNAASRSVLERQLRSWHMSCDVAQDAAGALALLESAAGAATPYGLALVDSGMPEIDGYALARTIRAQPSLSDLRLVLLTPSGARADALEDAAVDGVVSKPVRQSRLYEEIEAVMAGASRVAAALHPPAAPRIGDPRLDESRDVLVVEDTPVNQVVAVQMLEKSGFQAHVAENGRVALEFLAERSYAAVLMDCQMPELDGYETTRVIRRSEHGRRRTPIIAMTANSMQGERERCLAAGMDDYLTKPLRHQTLKDALTRWIPGWTDGGSPGANGAYPLPAGPADASDLLDEPVVAELELLDGDVLAGIRSLYFDESARLVCELEEAVGRGESAAVGRTAHKLKGSSRTIGAAHVADVAAELEAAAQVDDLTAAGDQLESLRIGLDETQTTFRARAAQPIPASSN